MLVVLCLLAEFVLVRTALAQETEKKGEMMEKKGKMEKDGMKMEKKTESMEKKKDQ